MVMEELVFKPATGRKSCREGAQLQMTLSRNICLKRSLKKPYGGKGICFLYPADR